MGNDCSGACVNNKDKEIRILSNDDEYSVCKYMISQKIYTLPKRIEEEGPFN